MVVHFYPFPLMSTPASCSADFRPSSQYRSKTKAVYSKLLDRWLEWLKTQPLLAGPSQPPAPCKFCLSVLSLCRDSPSPPWGAPLGRVPQNTPDGDTVSVLASFTAVMNPRWKQRKEELSVAHGSRLWSIVMEKAWRKEMRQLVSLHLQFTTVLLHSESHMGLLDR